MLEKEVTDPGNKNSTFQPLSSSPTQRYPKAAGKASLSTPTPQPHQPNSAGKRDTAAPPALPNHHCFPVPLLLLPPVPLPIRHAPEARSPREACLIICRGELAMKISLVVHRSRLGSFREVVAAVYQRWRTSCGQRAMVDQPCWKIQGEMGRVVWSYQGLHGDDT